MVRTPHCRQIPPTYGHILLSTAVLGDGVMMRIHYETI